jgi:hypothetical protein
MNYKDEIYKRAFHIENGRAVPDEDELDGGLYDDLVGSMNERAFGARDQVIQKFIESHQKFPEYVAEEESNAIRDTYKNPAAKPVGWGIGLGVPAAVGLTTGLLAKSKGIGAALALKSLPLSALAGLATAISMNEKYRDKNYGPVKREIGNDIYGDLDEYIANRYAPSMNRRVSSDTIRTNADIRQSKSATEDYKEEIYKLAISKRA